MKKLFLIFNLFILCLGGWSQSLDSTKLIFIDEIIIEGNRKTKPQIITRELSFKKGELFHRFQLDSMFEWNRNRIYNTNLFNEITFSIIDTAPGVANIKIVVDERWYFYPAPIFKLIDRNFNDWWVNRERDLSRVNIGMRLTQFNFRGRAERLRVTAQFGFTTVASITYLIPYIEKSQRHGLNVGFGFSEAKNLAVTTRDNVRRFLTGEDLLRTVYRSRVTHSYRSSFYSFHFLTVGHTNVNIADTVAAINPNYLGDSQTTQSYFQLGYQYAWDKRDNRNYPLKGDWYVLGASKFGLGLYNDGVDFWSFNFRLSKFGHLGKQLYYGSNAIGVLSFPEDNNYFNYFSIGFLRNVVRGHDLNIVEGSTYFIQKNEIKKKIFSHKQDISSVMPIRQFQTFPISLYGKIFFDQGYAKGYPNYAGSDLLDDRYLYSYGLGLDLILVNDAVLRFELSNNTLNQTNFFFNFKTAL